MAKPNGTQLKRLLNEKFGFVAYSVKRGRGTSSSWWYIDTPEEVPSDLKEKIEKFLVDEKIASTYYTDYGPNNHYSACILWTNL
jgi:hypothetical protein